MAAMSDPLFVDRRAAARLTSLSYSTLAHFKPHDGPPVVRVGRRVAYSVTDLAAWMKAHTSRPTRRRGRPRKGDRPAARTAPPKGVK